MGEIFAFLNQPLPMGITMLIGLVVLWFRVNDLKKSVESMQLSCKDQVRWCMNHFKGKEVKGGENL